MAHFPASQALGNAFTTFAKNAWNLNDDVIFNFADAIMTFCDTAIVKDRRSALMSRNIARIGAVAAINAPGLETDPNAVGIPNP